MAFIHKTPTGLIVYGFLEEEIVQKKVKLDNNDNIIYYNTKK